MRALVIAPQPFFSPRGTPLSVYYRTLITAELGVKVDLLTYGQGQDVRIEGVRIIRIPKFDLFGNIKVGPSKLKLFHDIVLMFKTFWLLTSKKYDYVHAHEEAVFFCLFLKPLFRFKLVYGMHSSLPQQLINFQFTRSRLLINLFERLEDAALRSSEAVITICEDLRQYADQKMKGGKKSFLIENSIFDHVRLSGEGADVRPENREAIDCPEGVPEGKRLIVYAGTLEPYQGIDLALKAFARVVRRFPDVFFLIAGGTKQQVDHYARLAQDLDLSEDCLFTGTVPKAKASEYTRRADVLLSPRITGVNTPLKIYEQLASGIPLVATSIYSHTQVLTDDACFLVAPEPEALAEGLIQALASDSRDMKVKNALLLYSEKYSRDTYKRKMKQMLESIY